MHEPVQAEDTFDFLQHIAPLLSSGAGARAETAAKALACLCRNVLDKPTDLRYRRVPVDGSAFQAKIASVPGALEVLLHVGFSRVAYPDRDYFVLHTVDARKIDGCHRELSIFLQTAARLSAHRCSRSLSSHTRSTSHGSDENVAAMNTDDDDDDVTRDADHDTTFAAGAAPFVNAASTCKLRSGTSTSGGVPLERQLAARSAVHRVAALQNRQQREQQQKQQRWAAAIVGLAVLFCTITIVACSSTSETEDPAAQEISWCIDTGGALNYVYRNLSRLLHVSSSK